MTELSDYKRIVSDPMELMLRERIRRLQEQAFRPVPWFALTLIVLMSLWDGLGHLTICLWPDYPSDKPDWWYWVHGMSTFRENTPAQIFWVCFHGIIALLAAYVLWRCLRRNRRV